MNWALLSLHRGSHKITLSVLLFCFHCSGTDENHLNLENYIEGPLRQIEAARKALYSPSLNARKRYASFNNAFSQRGKEKGSGWGLGSVSFVLNRLPVIKVAISTL